MSLTVVSKGGWFDITLQAQLSVGVIADHFLQIYVNGSRVGHSSFIFTQASTNQPLFGTNTAMIYLPAGVHQIMGYWATSGGTITAQGVNRFLTVKEL
jgi:hypothetical protein